MIYLKRWQTLLWSIDPGYFQLKQAVKTLVAILIALWFMRHETRLTQVMAAFAAGMSMQGIVATTWLSRLYQVLLFNSLYFALFIVGLLIRDSQELTAVVLVILGFAVNYARRFGLQTSMAPMIAWMLCFVATILPFQSTTQALLHIYGLLAGLLIAAAVMMLLFPQNYRYLFINNSNQLFKTLGQGMLDVRRYLLLGMKATDFETLPFAKIKTSLHHLLDSNQTIEENCDLDDQKRVDDILIHLYVLVNAYLMMLEAYRALHAKAYPLSRAGRCCLSRISKQFAHLFFRMRMRGNFLVAGSTIKVDINTLAEKFNERSLRDPTLVIALLHLKLSFTLINRHVCELVRGNNGT
ncbi:hypothetical protein GH742_02855 [Legionella sp. MW5194]|uniref:hypothetical protein n=1 Tax=Legionella sp. MW5194 TaxID=2662448 RepID=UPI00193CCACE|nr:hypothetical protein [Legionella sp. MW5194]QRN02894.1 hypothetical protein GH742_02855 [Legionella sp. MW5194]